MPYTGHSQVTDMGQEHRHSSTGARDLKPFRPRGKDFAATAAAVYESGSVSWLLRTSQDFQEQPPQMLRERYIVDGVGGSGE